VHFAVGRRAAAARGAGKAVCGELRTATGGARRFEAGDGSARALAAATRLASDGKAVSEDSKSACLL